MAITLGAITLPEDLVWEDEFEWTPVEDSIDTALSGSLVIQSGTRAKGRPITLSGTESHAWAPRSLVESLKVLADAPPGSLTLSYHGREFPVRFRYGEKPYTARPVSFYSGTPLADDFYTITVRLMEV